MSARAWTDEQLFDVHTRHEAGELWGPIGETYGISGDLAKWRYNRAKQSSRLGRVVAAGGEPVAPVSTPRPSAPVSGVEWAYSGDGATISAPFGRIGTLDELLAAAQVDLARWYVDRWTVNAYETAAKNADGELQVEPLRKVQAWLRPVPGASVVSAMRESILADMAAHAPRYAGVRYGKVAGGDRHMAVISLADHHIGSLAWAPETGESYDVYIAEELAAEAMTDIVHKVTAWPVEKVLFILGNDLVHVDRTVDGKGGTTTRGTMQETDGRWQKMFRAATQVSVAAIDMCRGIAPVEVIVKAGNHDTASTFMLGDVIQAWYRNDTSVTVTNDPTPRSYVEYGANGLGITHGHHEKPDKLPLLMATEAPAMWARTQFRDWLTGHRHRKGILMNEESGVQIYTMPSLCAGDSWHVEQGYHHRRSSEARIYHHDTGPVAQLTFNARKAA